MSTEPRCADCNEVMEPGFAMSRGNEMNQSTTWVSGIEEWSIWSGVKIKGREMRRVTAFRCPKCGLLRFYAQDLKSMP